MFDIIIVIALVGISTGASTLESSSEISSDEHLIAPSSGSALNTSEVLALLKLELRPWAIIIASNNRI